LTTREPHEFVLRALKPTDQDTILRWRNSDYVRTHMFTPDLIAPEEHAGWFEKVLLMDPRLYRVLSLADRDLGFVSFARDDDLYAIWTWGLYIGEQDAPRGSGSALGAMALTHAFTELEAIQVVSEAMAANERAIRLYDRLGFRRVGMRVITRTTPGTPEDVIIFSRSHSAWAADAPDDDGYATTDD
jgi:UDP-4-amino-4,6-dideoxy-N-acetyl-beta-L-altrosamine N-acetyltransferase